MLLYRQLRRFFIIITLSMTCSPQRTTTDFEDNTATEDGDLENTTTEYASLENTRTTEYASTITPENASLGSTITPEYASLGSTITPENTSLGSTITPENTSLGKLTTTDYVSSGNPTTTPDPTEGETEQPTKESTQDVLIIAIVVPVAVVVIVIVITVPCVLRRKRLKRSNADTNNQLPNPYELHDPRTSIVKPNEPIRNLYEGDPVAAKKEILANSETAFPNADANNPASLELSTDDAAQQNYESLIPVTTDKPERSTESSHVIVSPNRARTESVKHESHVYENRGMASNNEVKDGKHVSHDYENKPKIETDTFHFENGKREDTSKDEQNKSPDQKRSGSNGSHVYMNSEQERSNVKASTPTTSPEKSQPKDHVSLDPQPPAPQTEPGYMNARSGDKKKLGREPTYMNRK